ncbi:hypothetical protein EDD18DRAFT_1350557 [Armillaria luteobubalina]|uniref:Uncharacterized protein n=1 Tax=Armillaria luteobubalina TaxID=153913 RepID=A0AA39UR13_9AGAR|nr:hypothetical protein EDD18DRAFT_1350557 [Armillaria luteobubalina]
MDSNGTVLPTELLHEIVDMVADSDDDDVIPTLTAITQASDVMRSRAQKYIYETISLEPSHKDYIDELAQIFATDPMVLAEHPRTLELYCGTNAELVDAPILDTIISQMQNLEIASFIDLDMVGRPFIDSFASPSMAQITSVELSYVKLTFREFNIFLSSPCLIELLLGGLHIVEYVPFTRLIEQGTDFSAPDCSLPQPQSALRCPLKELRLDIARASDFAIMDLIATSRYPIIAEDSLVKVTLSSDYSHEQHVPLFQRFLDCKAIKPAKRLHLGNYELGLFTEPGKPTEYDPLRFDTFEFVELSVGIGRDWFQYEPEFQWWANSLMEVPAGSPLKRLRFIINFEQINVQALPDVTMDVWDDLDYALCGDNLELELLAIDIATRVPLPREDKLAVKRWLLKCLPGTNEKYFVQGTRWKNGRVCIARDFRS